MKNSNSVTPVSRCLAVVKAGGKGARFRMSRFEQFGGRAEQNHLAVLEQPDAAAEDKRLGDIVSDENHGLAQVLLQGFELLLNTAPGDRIEGAEWLVQENHRRIGGQRACHTDALALAAGKLTRHAPGKALGVEADQI